MMISEATTALIYGTGIYKTSGIVSHSQMSFINYDKCLYPFPNTEGGKP